MIPKSILQQVDRLSSGERMELLMYLAHTAHERKSKPETREAVRSAPGIPNPPPEGPKTIDDLFRILRDNQVDRMFDYLNRGGDPNVALNVNVRPIFLALSPEMVDLLLHAGARVNVIDDSGGTPAHRMATEDRRLPALERLVQAGADLTHIDSQFETPLDVAYRKGATATAQWLEASGAERGPLALYRRAHPFQRKVSAVRPVGQTEGMPSLRAPLRDRQALWQHLRDLIHFWDPATDWQLAGAPITTPALNTLAGIELPAACLEFYQSGIFDWLSWKAGTAELNSFWAAPDAIGRRPAEEIIPSMQDSNLGMYCWERDERGRADPAVRYSVYKELIHAGKKPPYSFHTGCRFSEFVANMVYWELADLTPVRRKLDLESSADAEAVRVRERLARTPLPRLRHGMGSTQFVAIYEGANMIYVEIEAPSRSMAYYGILGGETDEALEEVVDRENA